MREIDKNFIDVSVKLFLFSICEFVLSAMMIKFPAFKQGIERQKIQTF
jgi:hypothetical protein